MALPDDDPIEHIVVLMLENRSFDQMLGDFQRAYPDLDGINPEAPRRKNRDDSGQEYEQRPTTVRRASNDPHHDLAAVLRQIGEAPAVHGSDCRRPFVVRFFAALWEIVRSWLAYLGNLLGKRAAERAVTFKAAAAYEGHFVAEYVRSYPRSTPAQRDEIMGYYEIGKLPALHFLAQHFTICDRWFSSVPGPTWANRFFVHSGTARGVARMPDNARDFKGWALYDQRTIYDELTAHKKSWRIYFHDMPQTLSFTRQWESQNKLNYTHIDHFEADVAGLAAKFPEFVFVEPQYSGDDANDDHPPYDIMRGQALIARIYNGIRANEALWKSTLLIVIYDEHGGFYDHVEPPAAPAPDKCTLEYSFDRLGVRVPVVLVSPWTAAGHSPSDKAIHFDHTSIGKYLCDRWGLKPLGERMRMANSIKFALRLTGALRSDSPGFIPDLPVGEPTAAVEPNENQIALNALSEHLDQLASGKPPAEFRGAAMKVKPDPDVIRERILRFLRQPT